MKLQRFVPQIVALLAVIVAFASCSTNRRAAPAAGEAYTGTPTAAELAKGWSLHFCTSETIDDNVKVELGRSGSESTRMVWRSFNPRTNPIMLLPDDLRYADKLWIKMTSENNRQVEACLKYNGNSAKSMSFDNTAEADIDRTNSEDCGC